MRRLMAALVLLLACSVLTVQGHASMRQVQRETELGTLEKKIEEAFSQILEERELDDALQPAPEDKQPAQVVRDVPRMSQNKRSAAAGMRAFNRASKSTRQIMEQMDRRNDRLDALLSRLAGDNPALKRRLQSLGLNKRADEDPHCNTTDTSCSLSGKRLFVTNSTREFRMIDGSCNNVDNFSFGKAHVQHLRVVEQAYDNNRWNPRADSVTSTRGNTVALPHVRDISLALHRYSGSTTPTNTQGITTLLFQWGQFLDHDIIKSPEGTVNNFNCCDTSQSTSRPFCMPIVVEAGDPYFTNGICMDARRSFTVLECDDDSGFQNQINDITAYIDASNVYGSSEEEVDALRSGIGGFLKTSTGNFPPEATDVDDLPCDEPDKPGFCFEAGDTRANVLPGLTALHTVFVRQHNIIAAKLAEVQSDWEDERLFQETRNIVAAMMQKITYSEFLPAVLDSEVLSDHGVSSSYSYNSSLDASIIQAFAIAFRIGHSWIPGQLRYTVLEGSTNQDIESVDTEDAFKKPSLLFKHNYKGLDEMGLWLANSGCPAADRYLESAAVDDLFRDAEGFSFDLPALNNMRAREWGMPGYTKFREYCGFSVVTTWSDLNDTFSADTLTAFQTVYDDPNDIDPFSGFVSEIPIGSSLAGPVTSCILAKQFHNSKHGDRFFYQTSDTNVGFTADQRVELEKVTIARVMCDTLDLAEMRQNAFDSDSAWKLCSNTNDIPEMNLSVWG